MPHQLSWSHMLVLLPIKDVNKINYYINLAEKHCLSYRDLHKKIKNKEYERLDDTTKDKLINIGAPAVTDFIKNPIIIKNTTNKEIISEKALHQLILENLDDFLKELGNSFCYI